MIPAVRHRQEVMMRHMPSHEHGGADQTAAYFL
jgi:hypothetical protein